MASHYAGLEMERTIQGATTAGVKNNPALPPLPKLEAVTQDLLKIGDSLFSQINRLESIGDKLFGSFPEDGQGAVGRPIANGDVERIEQNIGSLSDMVERLAVAVQRLERL